MPVNGVVRRPNGVENSCSSGWTDACAKHAEQQPAQPAALGGAEDGPRGQQQGQNQKTVDGIVAVVGDGHGRDHDRKRRRQTGDRPESAAHEQEEHAD